MGFMRKTVSIITVVQWTPSQFLLRYSIFQGYMQVSYIFWKANNFIHSHIFIILRLIIYSFCFIYWYPSYHVFMSIKFLILIAYVITEVVLVTFLLTLNRFKSLFWCFHRWLCTSTCRLGQSTSITTIDMVFICLIVAFIVGFGMFLS